MHTLLQTVSVFAFAFLNRVRGGILDETSKLFATFAKVLMTLFITLVAFANTHSIITAAIVGAVFLIGIVTVFGSINPFKQKEGAGAIKQWFLGRGYQTIGVVATNSIGLAITGILQSLVVATAPNVPLITPVIVGALMPVCYILCYNGFQLYLCKYYLGIAIIEDELRMMLGAPHRFYCLDNAKEWLWALVLGAVIMFL